MKKTKYLDQIQTMGTVPRVATATSFNITKQEYLENIEVYKNRGFAFTPLQVTKHNILIAHFDQTSQIIDVNAYRKKRTKLAQLNSICAYGCIPSIKTAQKNELSCVEFENALNKYLGTQNISSLTEKRKKKLDELRKHYNRPVLSNELLSKLETVIDLLRNG